MTTTTSVTNIDTHQTGIMQATVDNTTEDKETSQFHPAFFCETNGQIVTLPSVLTALDVFNLVFDDNTNEMIAQAKMAQHFKEGRGNLAISGCYNSHENKPTSARWRLLVYESVVGCT